MNKKNYFLKLKELSKICLLSAGLVFSSMVVGQDVTTGLILNYNFDNISGNTVPDVSGNNNAGVLNGAMLTPVEGYNGQGVEGLVKGDYINLPANITTSLTSFTYATWVNLTALKNATRFFDFGNGADASNNFLAFIPSFNGDNMFMCLRFRPASGTAYNVQSTTKLPVGAWAHVALTSTWDAGASLSTVRIYLNGAEVGSGTMPFNPTQLGATADNYVAYSRWNQDTNGFSGKLDDVRIYNRALTANDVLNLSGLSELNNQFKALTLPAVTATTTQITIPKTLGTQGVVASWTSSNPAVLDTMGVVNHPAKYDAPVKLTATLTHVVAGKTYTMTKEFIIIVPGLIPTPAELAQWNFDGSLISAANGEITVTDKKSQFVGTLKNEARIRTIGSSTKFNVLDLGNGKGYMDMGTEIGRAIYSLTNYTMCGYFRIDESYDALNSNGNFYWTFSNTDNADVDRNGYIIGSLKGSNQSVATNYWNIGNQATGTGANAAKGGWHHFAYVQNGNTGTTYIDGVQTAQNTAMTNLPALALPKAGLTGTMHNWLGRSNYVNDVYLRKTLLYDFRILSESIGADDLNFGLEVPATIQELDVAYSENPDFVDPALTTAVNNLTLPDLSAVTANIALPTSVSDPSVKLTWKSSNNSLIDGNGVVTRPDYFDYPVTLTAVLFKDGQTVTKDFAANVVVKPGTQFQNDLLVKFDFSQVSDSVVTDVAEKRFQGRLKNKAKVQSIGISDKYYVLNLGDSIGYFDMGTEVGKVMYNLTDYTISAYYRIDTAYLATDLTRAGNFIWTFSNSNQSGVDRNGYLIGSLNNQSVSITPKFYEASSGNQAVSYATPPLRGGWHNMTYTQSGTKGTLYVDGMWAGESYEITNTPANSLRLPGRMGTLYNWIGRSNFTSDVYLRKTLVHDLRIYNRALDDAEIMTTLLNVSDKLEKLDMAYAEDATSVKSIVNSDYKVTSTEGAIRILGLKGAEKVSLFDVAGRQIQVANPMNIKVNAGVYIVKINNFTSKVVVK